MVRWQAARRRTALYEIGRTLGMPEAIVDEVVGTDRLGTRSEYLAARAALRRDLRPRLGGLGRPVEPSPHETDQQPRDPGQGLDVGRRT